MNHNHWAWALFWTSIIGVWVILIVALVVDK